MKSLELLYEELLTPSRTKGVVYTIRYNGNTCNEYVASSRSGVIKLVEYLLSKWGDMEYFNILNMSENRIAVEYKKDGIQQNIEFQIITIPIIP